MLSLRSGGPPLQSFRVLRAFNNYCCSILHTLFTTCHALWVNVDCGHAHHVAHSPKISPCLSCCYCHAELVSYLVNGLGNNCAGQLHQPNRRCFGKGSATASFGLGNSFPGARTPPTKQAELSVESFIMLVINAACVVFTSKTTLP